MLNHNDIDVWVCHTPSSVDESSVKPFIEVMSDSEKHRYHRFVSAKDRALYAAGRALLRNRLSYYYPEVSPSDWPIEIGSDGKPRLGADAAIRPTIHFNLTHTKSTVVSAFCLAGEIGIDIESIHRILDFERMAAYVFSESERKQLPSVASTEYARVFFSLWTLKESYLKAKGNGLALPLKRFSFYLNDQDDSATLCSEFESPSTPWFFWQGPVNPEFRVALSVELTASSPHSLAVRLRDISL